MDNRSFRIVIQDMCKSWKKVVVFVSIITVLFAVHGFLKARRQANEIADIENDETYVQVMEEFQTSLDDAKEAISESVKMRDEEQGYIDNSIYMQLDSNKIYIANCQYTVSSNVAPGYNANIINVYNSYVKEGGFTKELAKAYAEKNDGKPIEEQYLKELIAITPSNPIFSISVMCLDQDMADGMLQAIYSVINTYKPQVEKAADSEFTIEEIGAETILKADSAVLNAQNNHLNSLKNYNATLRDLRQNRANTIENMNNYKKDKMPEKVIYDSTKKAVCKWIVFGVVSGVVLYFAIMCLLYILGGKLKNPDDMTASGITVLFRYVKGRGYTPDIQRALAGVEAMAVNKEAESINIWALSETDDSKKAIDDLTKKLLEEGSTLQIRSVCYSDSAGVKDMKKIISEENVMLLVEIGKTAYKDIEEQKYLLASAGVDIWGCIAVC